MNFKDDSILRRCRGKKVLHLGATDYPYHKEKAARRILLHQKIGHVAKEVVGLDVSRKAIKELKDYGINNISFHDIMRPFPKKYHGFDLIIMGDVLEHLANPGIALENLRKIMGKDTQLIITVPNCYCYFNIFNIFRKKEDVHPDHFFWPSKATMSNMLKTLGFRITGFDYVNFGSYSDIKTIKGKIFYYIFLRPIKKIRAGLFFIVRSR